MTVKHFVDVLQLILQWWLASPMIMRKKDIIKQTPTIMTFNITLEGIFHNDIPNEQSHRTMLKKNIKMLNEIFLFLPK